MLPCAMVWVSASDDSLSVLLGAEIHSPLLAGVRYRIDRPLGEGGSGVAFLAERLADIGRCAVVMKFVRPSLVLEDPQAPLFVRKEAVALGRLNERVPATPFVVRLMDTGALPVDFSGRRLELPWLAVEYVHGGVEGATLGDRVDWSIDTTGFAFEPERAALAVECLARALGAVHEVGVIHRDLKPDNVLCCGFGDDELFKLADFGIARPAGMAATFGGGLFGTPGYAAPEMQGSGAHGVGPATDVFSFAAVVFYLLTGEHYFDVSSPHGHLVAVAQPERRSLLDTRYLAPTLRERGEGCRTIDAELARATQVFPDRRPPNAWALGTALLSSLRFESRRTAPASFRARAMAQSSRGTRIGRMVAYAPTVDAESWSWTIRRQPGYGRKLFRAAWAGDGRCLAVAEGGLIFWDGTAWRDAVDEALPAVIGVRFLHRAGPGFWILGGAGAAWGYSATGVVDVLDDVDRTADYQLFSGDLADLGVFVAVEPSGTWLRARVGGWWLEPLSLPTGTAVRALSRIDAATWLVVGDDEHDEAFAALYSPLRWRLERLPTPRGIGLRSCAGHPDRRVGMAAGVGGAVLWLEAGASTIETVPGAALLTSGAVDAVGRAWLGETGRIWMRRPRASLQRPSQHPGMTGSRWEVAWHELGWTAPMLALHADVGQVLAVAADGSIVEGRRTDRMAAMVRG